MPDDQSEKRDTQPVEQHEARTSPETAVLDRKRLRLPSPMTIQITEHPESIPVSGWGSALLGKRAQLRIEVEGHPDQPIFLEIEESVVFGRGNPATSITPYLDLTPYDAQKKGVSREHLALIKEGNTLKVADLDSTNGTYLNGIRLYPHQPRIVRSGDQLFLGQLALKILTMA